MSDKEHTFVRCGHSNTRFQKGLAGLTYDGTSLWPQVRKLDSLLALGIYPDHLVIHRAVEQL